MVEPDVLDGLGVRLAGGGIVGEDGVADFQAADRSRASGNAHRRARLPL